MSNLSGNFKKYSVLVVFAFRRFEMGLFLERNREAEMTIKF
jgi:hypothetical protein